MAIWFVAATIACGDNLDTLDHFGAPGATTAAALIEDVPTVELSLTGHVPRRFLVDTGSYFTGIDTDVYPEFAFDQGIHHLSVTGFGMRFPGWPVAALDLFPYRLASGVEIHGVVGGDLLAQFDLSVDYQAPQVWLSDPLGDDLPAGMDRAAVGPRIDREAEVAGGGMLAVPGNCPGGCGTAEFPPSRFLIDVSAEAYDEPLRFLIDTGSSISIITEFHMVRMGDLGRPRLPVRLGTASGPVDAYITRLGRLRVEGGGEPAELTSVPVLVVPGGPGLESLTNELGQRIDGILGGSFLREFLVTLDYRDARLRLARYRDRAHIDPREYISVGFRFELDADDRWVVGRVLPGTDAEAVGMTEGDRLIRFGEVALAGRSFAELEQIIAGYELGDSIPVVIERDDVMTLLVEVEDLLPAFDP